MIEKENSLRGGLGDQIEAAQTAAKIKPKKTTAKKPSTPIRKAHEPVMAMGPDATLNRREVDIEEPLNRQAEVDSEKPDNAQEKFRKFIRTVTGQLDFATANDTASPANGKFSLSGASYAIDGAALLAVVAASTFAFDELVDYCDDQQAEALERQRMADEDGSVSASAKHWHDEINRYCLSGVKVAVRGAQLIVKVGQLVFFVTGLGALVVFTTTGYFVIRAADALLHAAIYSVLAIVAGAKWAAKKVGLAAAYKAVAKALQWVYEQFCKLLGLNKDEQPSPILAAG